MRFSTRALAYSSAAAAVVGSAVTVNAAEPQIVQKDRSYYAYGYEGDTTEGAPNGYAFGMGGLEKTAYDSKEKILYGVSEQGIITLIDYGNGAVQPPQLPFAVKSENVYTDVHVCSEEGILFASSKDDPNPGVVSVFKAATRSDDAVVEPELIHTLPVGYGPDYMNTNSDCSILAIANEGEGYYKDDYLINNVGSVSLVRGPFLDAATPPVVSDVAFPWTDDELIEKGIHLPLSANALEYWDEHSSIADDLNFTEARASYTTASVLEPEWLVWTPDDQYVLVNLQENCALVKINVANDEAEDIYSYGLKSWEETPIDIVEDDGCSSMPTVEGFYSLRSPDAIKLVTVGEDIYIITANEGDDVAYGDFEERVKSSDIFDGSSLLFEGLTADSAIFDAASPMSGQSKYFNNQCGEMEGSPDWCANSMRLTIGTESIDYSDPTAPIFKKLVAIGGRGLSIYKFTDEGLEMVWDSGDEFEREGCAAFPWAHNAIQDEEFADVNGTLYMSDEDIQETLIEMNDPEEDGCEDRGDGEPGACAMGDTVDERSLKDGYAAEAIVAGEACGKHYMVTVSEKNSVGFLYDISDITSPKLAQVFHLSPASETKNPIVAYSDRTLGEIDSESILFIEKDKSPTGKAALIFAGAFSTTTSFWEFDCGTDDTATDDTSSETAEVPSDVEESTSYIPQIVRKDRSYYAYGYEGDTTEGAPNGYAFGMGGLEKTAYDSKEKILYGVSEQGIITLIDYGNGAVQPPQLPFAVKSENVYTDVHVCSEEGILFASSKDDPNPGVVSIFKAATRSDDAVVEPELIHTLPVGYGPDYMNTNSDCSILAIANEGEGYYKDDYLINNVGSVSLVRGPFLDAATPPVVSDVAFPWTDDELIEKGIHLPLSANALEYWDEHSSIADDLNFTEARASYTTASVLEPEWLVWTPDDQYVLVNLQENCALVKINVTNDVAEDIYSYGLKSWEETPIDIVEDDGCSSMPTVEGFYSLRSPDAIKLVTVGEDIYIITANEGDDVAYGDFEERVKSSDIFDGSSLLFEGLTADSAIFDAASPMSGQSKYFNNQCGEMEGSPDWCANSMRLTIGTESIDYSDPTAPIFKKLVAIGGRGLSIYKFTDEGLEMVWDSGDEFEREGCAAFPWAHNAIQDEEFADVNGTLYMSDEDIQETLIEMNDPEEDGCEDRGDGEPGACAMGDTVDERSLKDGYAAEAIVAGEACGKHYMVTVSEKNSVGFLYDISDITSPKLAQVFHLSPASETKNPIVAYSDRTLGEIDSESILFIEKVKSPTGKAALIFAGAFSTTTSFWEFDCGTDDTATDETSETSAPAPSSASVARETSYGVILLVIAVFTL